jgi:hypothetical protein
MNLTCVMLVAMLCGPAEYKGTIHEFSGNRIEPTVPDPAVVARLGVQIDVYWPGRPGFASRSAMDRACNGETCIYYRKLCDAERRACDFLVGFNISTPNMLYFRIRYRSLRALRGAERRIFLVTAPNSSKGVSLSQLDRLSETTAFVACPTGSAAESKHMQGCD